MEDRHLDPLTNLPNRAALIDRMNRAMRQVKKDRGYRFALLRLEIGCPAAGDAESSSDDAKAFLVSTVARRLQTTLQALAAAAKSKGNGFVARLEGEQFAILLDDLRDLRDIKNVGERILSTVLAPIPLGRSQAFLTAGLGAALSGTRYLRAEDVLDNAATALWRARAQGGSCVEIFDVAGIRASLTEAQLEQELNVALDRGEFGLVYQPIVSLAADRIIGVEALARWQHPVLGPIPPADFIPLAEKNGSIRQLGASILRGACAQLRTWQRSLPSTSAIYVSVNLSSSQFKDPSLVEDVGAALREATLDARGLMLELTEGAAMENPEAMTTLAQLRALGVRISIDDFGTGFTSLDYLRELPAHALKIDRSFIRRMESEPGAAAIVESIAAMARQLGRQTVAEGVENKEQLALLRSLQVDAVQGFLFAEPLEADAATLLITPTLTLPVGAATQRITPRPVPRVEARPRRHEAVQLAWLAAIVVAAILLGMLASRTADSKDAPVVALTTAAPIAAARVASTPDAPAAAGPAASDASKKSNASSNASRATAAAAPAATVAPARPDANVPSAPVTARTPVTASPATAPRIAAMLDVEHQHRLGNCDGRLVVTTQGLQFVPGGKAEKDAFSLKPVEFLASTSGDTLTIKSNDRTYRFKAASSNGKNDGSARLREFVDVLNRLR